MKLTQQQLEAHFWGAHWHYAPIDRAAKVMRPYFESVACGDQAANSPHYVRRMTCLAVN